MVKNLLWEGEEKLRCNSETKDKFGKKAVDYLDESKADYIELKKIFADTYSAISNCISAMNTQVESSIKEWHRILNEKLTLLQQQLSDEEVVKTLYHYTGFHKKEILEQLDKSVLFEEDKKIFRVQLDAADKEGQALIKNACDAFKKAAEPVKEPKRSGTFRSFRA